MKVPNDLLRVLVRAGKMEPSMLVTELISEGSIFYSWIST